MEISSQTTDLITFKIFPLMSLIRRDGSTLTALKERPNSLTLILTDRIPRVKTRSQMTGFHHPKHGRKRRCQNCLLQFPAQNKIKTQPGSGQSRWRTGGKLVKLLQMIPSQSKSEQDLDLSPGLVMTAMLRISA